jgi:hypothetical protein
VRAIVVGLEVVLISIVGARVVSLLSTFVKRMDSEESERGIMHYLGEIA